jgi:hypothetical protein
MPASDQFEGRMRAKLTATQRDELVQRRLAGEKLEALAAEYGCDQSYACILIKRRKKTKPVETRAALKVNALLSFGA